MGIFYTQPPQQLGGQQPQQARQFTPDSGATPADSPVARSSAALLGIIFGWNTYAATPFLPQRSAANLPQSDDPPVVSRARTPAVLAQAFVVADAAIIPARSAANLPQSDDPPVVSRARLRALIAQSFYGVDAAIMPLRSAANLPQSDDPPSMLRPAQDQWTAGTFDWSQRRALLVQGIDAPPGIVTPALRSILRQWEPGALPYYKARAFTVGAPVPADDPPIPTRTNLNTIVNVCGIPIERIDPYVYRLSKITLELSSYWVAGTGNWSDATNHWASESGGAPAVGNLPNSALNAYFDVNSNNPGGGSYTCTVNSSRIAKSIDIKNPSAGVMTLSNTGSLQIFGSWRVDGNILFTGGGVTLSSTGLGNTITTNGVAFPAALSFAGVGGSWLQASDLMVTTSASLTAGVWDLNDNNLTVPVLSSSVTTNPRTIKMRSGLLLITGTSANPLNFATTNLTVEAGTSTIKFTGSTASTKSISLGNNFTYNNIWHAPGTGTGTLSLQGQNAAINELRDDGTAAHTFQFLAGATYTISSFNISGNPGARITLASTSATPFILSKAGGGIVSCDYLSISRSTAINGDGWYAGDNSIDGGSNSGWIFASASGPQWLRSRTKLFALIAQAWVPPPPAPHQAIPNPPPPFPASGRVTLTDRAYSEVLLSDKILYRVDLDTL